MPELLLSDGRRLDGEMVKQTTCARTEVLWVEVTVGWKMENETRRDQLSAARRSERGCGEFSVSMDWLAGEEAWFSHADPLRLGISFGPLTFLFVDEV